MKLCVALLSFLIVTPSEPSSAPHSEAVLLLLPFGQPCVFA